MLARFNHCHSYCGTKQGEKDHTLLPEAARVRLRGERLGDERVPGGARTGAGAVPSRATAGTGTGTGTGTGRRRALPAGVRLPELPRGRERKSFLFFFFPLLLPDLCFLIWACGSCFPLAPLWREKKKIIKERRKKSVWESHSFLEVFSFCFSFPSACLRLV